jgi:hypothetical protein
MCSSTLQMQRIGAELRFSATVREEPEVEVALWSSYYTCVSCSRTPLPGVFSEVRNVQDALYTSGHPCRFESSATRIHCRADAEFPDLKFRTWLSDGTPALEVALV